MIAASGVRFVRMDFAWGSTETAKGVYDFSQYERLLDALDQFSIRALFILDYGNPLYDGGVAPCTDLGRAAFAKWASVGVSHFAGRGIIWEMWNEPNGMWLPKPNVQDYILLAKAVGQALQRAAPTETFVGPATSGVDFAFIRSCFDAGLLDYWTAVSVHPYRNSVPETVTPDYASLRQLIANHTSRSVPIVSSEWGYSARYAHWDVDLQGKALPRMWLTNIANNISLSIWYDWHDDGTNQTWAENHFGMVLWQQHDGRTPLFDPKPAYNAARTMHKLLDGCVYDESIALGDADAYCMRFLCAGGNGRAKGGDNNAARMLAAWTSDSTRIPLVVDIPVDTPGQCLNMTDVVGQPLGTVCAPSSSTRIQFALDDGPTYLGPY